jgi:hypothetical protein
MNTSACAPATVTTSGTYRQIHAKKNIQLRKRNVILMLGVFIFWQTQKNRAAWKTGGYRNYKDIDK